MEVPEQVDLVELKLEEVHKLKVVLTVSTVMLSEQLVNLVLVLMPLIVAETTMVVAEAVASVKL